MQDYDAIKEELTRNAMRKQLMDDAKPMSQGKQIFSANPATGQVVPAGMLGADDADLTVDAGSGMVGDKKKDGQSDMMGGLTKLFSAFMGGGGGAAGGMTMAGGFGI